MSAPRAVVWSQALADAVRTIATDQDLSPDTRSRGADMYAGARVGAVLAPHQVSYVQALRQRLPFDPDHGFEAAWNAAWNAEN